MVTGRSSAKRAKRLAAKLKKYQKYLETIEAREAYRSAQGGVLAATGAVYGMPGSESSGVQAARGSIRTQAVSQLSTTSELNDLVAQIQYNIKRAKKKAKSFKIGLAAITAITAGAAGAFSAAAAGSGAAGTAASNVTLGAVASGSLGAAGTSAAALGGVSQLGAIASIASAGIQAAAGAASIASLASGFVAPGIDMQGPANIQTPGPQLPGGGMLPPTGTYYGPGTNTSGGRGGPGYSPSPTGNPNIDTGGFNKDIVHG
jgi:hypothetical protein